MYADMISTQKFTKGHNSIKQVHRVMFPNTCILSANALYIYTKFSYKGA